ISDYANAWCVGVESPVFIPHPTGFFVFSFFTDTAPTEIYTLSLHDALPIFSSATSTSSTTSGSGNRSWSPRTSSPSANRSAMPRSEEHTSELQSRRDLVCRLLLEKKKPPQTR